MKDNKWTWKSAPELLKTLKDILEDCSCDNSLNEAALGMIILRAKQAIYCAGDNILRMKNIKYPKPCECLYHVFTNDGDEWVEDLKEAVKLARQWAREFGCVRIYKETEWDENTGLFIEEDCILSHGSFPY